MLKHNGFAEYVNYVYSEKNAHYKPDMSESCYKYEDGETVGKGSVNNVVGNNTAAAASCDHNGLHRP